MVFDAYWWVAGPPSLRHVLRETVTQWRRQFPDDEITLVVRAESLNVARAELPPDVRLVGTRWWPQALSAVIACRRAKRTTGADVVITQNFATSGPRLKVVYIHDVLFKSNPEWFTLPERLYFSFMPLLSRCADLVLTSTHSESQRIVAHSPVDHVVPVGIGMSDELADAPAVDPPFGLARGNFLLTVGRLNVRKNLVRTIEAAVDSGTVRADRPLVIVGEEDGKAVGRSPRIDQAVADGSVRFLGFVENSELKWLYQNATLFLFMSLGEGFGMPPVEALHFGCRMIVSDLAVFREILPATVRRVAPDDTAALAAAIREEIGGSVGAGSDTGGPDVRAHDYTWERTVGTIRAAVVDHLNRV